MRPAILNAADLEIRSALRALLPIQADADLPRAVPRILLLLHGSDLAEAVGLVDK